MSIGTIIAEVKENYFENRAKSVFSLALQAEEFKGMMAYPGQFAVLEPITIARRPFSIRKIDVNKGILYLWIQRVGKNTEYYAGLKVGSRIKVQCPKGSQFIPPMNKDGYILVSGGAGFACMPGISASLQALKYDHILSAGFRNEDEVFGLLEMSLIDRNFKIATDAPSKYSHHGSAVSLLSKILRYRNGDPIVIACGPKQMLQAVFVLCKERGLPCFVNTEIFMGCGGSGACFGCSIPGHSNQRWRACKEGPIFNAYKIDWEAFMRDAPAPALITRYPENENPLAVDLKLRGKVYNLRSPIMIASGSIGKEKDDLDNPALENVGAIFAKGICMEPNPGNLSPRLYEVGNIGLLNAIGLEGVGAKIFKDKHIPLYRPLIKKGALLFVNIWGRTIEEFVQVVYELDSVEEIAGYEVNISCPNVKEGGMHFNSDPRTICQLAIALRSAATKPLIFKLTPNDSDDGVVAAAKAAVDGGADAISAINTVTGMVIDIFSRKPVLSNDFGGLSGPAIRPRATYLAHKLFSAKLNVPIIGIGGISAWEHAIERIMAGACAFQIGTSYMSDPGIISEFKARMEAFLKERNLNSIMDLIGTAALYKT